MNSQFRNSNIGSIIYIGIIIIIALGLIIISWYMLAGYRIGTYSEDTILGSVYLGGLREDDITLKVNQRTDRWVQDETIVYELTYQGYSYEFDRNLFFFNLELSKEFLRDGETNELIAEYQQDSSDRVDTINEIYSLPFLADIKDNIDYDTLVSDILEDAGFLRTYSSKAIEDYLIDPTLAIEDISSIEFHIPEGINVDTFVQSVTQEYGEEYITIESKVLFDMIEELGESLNDVEMTILSSAMLELSLATNFSIHETHYVPFIDAEYTVDDYPYFGRNTAVNKIVGNSFSIYNPNTSDYKFKLEKVDEDTARLTLVGINFVDTIVAEKEMTEIDFITQYTDNDDLLQEGSNGMIVVVYRTITNLYGEEIYNKEILFEFYPPVIQIELEPVIG
jgi:hypothetical protein